MEKTKLARLGRQKLDVETKFQGMPQRYVKNQGQQKQKQAKTEQTDGKKAYFGNLRGKNSTKFDEILWTPSNEYGKHDYHPEITKLGKKQVNMQHIDNQIVDIME